MANAIRAASASVLTYHNDKARTGQNPNETVLTLANVNTNSFGLLFTYAVDGYVYAQPLILANVSIPSKGVHNVLYVVTEHDGVYAFDADSNGGSNAAPLWQVSFINPSAGITSVPNGDVICDDLVPEIGITSTPVIDPIGGTIYVVAKTREVVSGVTNYVYRLHALDVTTGTEKLGGPVLIQGSVLGTGIDTDGSGHVSFSAFLQLNRMALLLNNGVVYFGCGSHCDNNPYHGWLFGFNAQTLGTNGIFNSTANAERGGIWGSGCGPACDTNGNLYVSTGNGTFDSINGDYSDTLLKLSTTNSLVVVDYFTPYNHLDLDTNDTDLASGGVVLLPDEAGSGAHPHLVVCAGKEGTLYLVDRENMGKFNAAGDTQIVQSLPGAIGSCFDTPAYFNNTLYFVGVNDVIKAFTITDGSIISTPASQGSTVFGFPGATPSISANGTNDGIAWAIQSDAYLSSGPSILHAYNAAHVSQELYNSTQAGGRDILAGAVKFTVPTIANGKVYVGTESTLSVFGNFVAAPTIAPNGGTFTNSILVTLADATPGAAIYYTLDNTVPTTSSALYTGPFSLTTSATVSARAFLGGVTGSAAVSADFTIISLQPPTADFTGSPTTGPTPLTITFTDDSTGSITNRSWSFGDGGTTNTVNTIVGYTYNSTGTNTVTLIVSGPLGVSTNARLNYIVVTNNLPQLTIVPGSRDFGLLPVGQSSTQSFSIANTGLQILSGIATASGAGFALASGSPFNVNAGQTGLVSVSFSPGSTGSFTGSVVFVSNGGISTNAVTGSAAIASSAGFTGNPTNGAATLLVNFTDASSGTVTSRVWNFGDGGASTLTSPSHPYTNAGAFSVSLMVFGPLGSNTLTLSNYITVTNLAGAPIAGFIASPTNGAAPLLVNFTDVSMGSITNRSWTFGDGNTSVAVNPSHTYSNAGTYSVALTVSGPGGSGVTNLVNLVTVTNIVSTSPTVTILRPANGMLYPPVTNLVITVVAAATANNGAAISKIEFFADSTKLGETTSNPGTNFLFNPTLGTHIITARATDALGATNTSTVTITIGARNSPVGNWEVTVSGADRGAQFLTFKDDFSASGFGIRLKQFGLETVSGHWGFNASGRVTGPFFEETGDVTNWNGTLLGPVRSLRSVNGTVVTAASGIYHWRGITATTFRDLSGIWTGLVTVARTPAAPVSYIFSPNANNLAVFDIATSADPGTVVGQLLVTSRNRVYGYVTYGGKPVTMSGLFNIRRLAVNLNGSSNAGEKVKVRIAQ
jgi:PKD repeat protein